VPLALGTDGGPSFEVTATAREVGLYVAAGVPAPAALRAATAGNADALALGDAVGRLRAGLGADIIAVPDDPQADVAHLLHVRMVMKDGHLVCLDDCGDAASPAGEPAK
jgi:imidazolonepropionase-like amidohydrolase